MHVIQRTSAFNPYSATIQFHCPGCHTTHGVNSTFAFNGNLVRPTIRPAIRAEGTDEHGATTCHAFVTDGKIEFLGDCTHSLRNKTARLQPFVPY